MHRSLRSGSCARSPNAVPSAGALPPVPKPDPEKDEQPQKQKHRARPMPSKRPSPSPLDAAAAAAHLHPTPPKSKKRSSRAKAPRMDDPNPNPNSNSKPHSSSDSPPAAPSRKSERKRKPRSFPDSSASGARRAGAPDFGGHGAGQKLWSDADEVALLTGAAAFRARTGGVPRLPDMRALFDSLKGSISPHLDQAKVYYKLKRLKSKFLHTAPAAAGGGPHDRRVRDLCAEVWGSDAPAGADEDAEGEDADERDIEERDGGEGEAPTAARRPVVSEVLGEYWRANRHALSGVSLEKGMALLGAEEGRAAEAKWRKQLEAEMRTRMRRHEISKEVYGLLIDAVKGLGP